MTQLTREGGLEPHFQQYSSYIVVINLLVEEIGVPGENH